MNTPPENNAVRLYHDYFRHRENSDPSLFYVVPYFRVLNPSGQIAAKGWFAYSWLILYFILGCLVLRGSGGVIVPSEQNE